MIEEGHPGAGCRTIQYGIDDLLRRVEGKGDAGDDHPRARALGHAVQHVTASVVFVIARQQLVVGSQLERAQHRVDGRRGVGDPGQILRFRAEEFRQLFAGLVQQGFQVAHEELHRLPLEPFSMITATAISGASSGAKAMKSA